MMRALLVAALCGVVATAAACAQEAAATGPEEAVRQPPAARP